VNAAAVRVRAPKVLQQRGAQRSVMHYRYCRVVSWFPQARANAPIPRAERALQNAHKMKFSFQGPFTFLSTLPVSHRRHARGGKLMSRLFRVERLVSLGAFILVLLQIRCTLTSAAFSAHSLDTFWLAKTRETFKLSDLQYLEAKLQARDYDCKRLVLDAATGSSLFCLHGDHLREVFSNNTPLPSSLEGCDWIASILSQGKSAEELLANIRRDGRFLDHNWNANATWTLDYMRMNDEGAATVKALVYTSKSLLSCIAQAIVIPAALNPATATDRLRVVDTGQDLFLVRLLRDTEPTEILVIKKWNQRPFPYSSAINPNVAEILIALVLDLAEQQFGKEPSEISFLDPTCGSGTFLAFALARGASVRGWDTNPACVAGALCNLHCMFGEESAQRCGISLRDATQKLPDDSKKFDSTIANLPWGQNSVLYYNNNVHILESLPSSLPPGAPCAFISKDVKLQKDMNRLGYQILGTAHIPPLGFVLPSGKKTRGKKKIRGDTAQDDSSSICVVTVALAPG